MIAYERDNQIINTGFSATAFLNEEEKCIMIAYCGTEDLIDINVDIAFAATDFLQRQHRQALEFYGKIANEYGKMYSIKLTGHSLGGTLATYVCALTNAETITVNGANGVALNNIMSTVYGNIDNYIKSYPEANIFTKIPCEWNCTNYLTEVVNGNFFTDFMGWLNDQFHGLQTDLLKGYIGTYAKQQAKDAHNVFAFMEYNTEKERFVLKGCNTLTYGTKNEPDFYDLSAYSLSLLYYCNPYKDIYVKHKDIVNIKEDSADIITIKHVDLPPLGKEEVTLVVNNSNVEVRFEGDAYVQNKLKVYIPKEFDADEIYIAGEENGERIIRVSSNDLDMTFYVKRADCIFVDKTGKQYTTSSYK